MPWWQGWLAGPKAPSVEVLARRLRTFQYYGLAELLHDVITLCVYDVVEAEFLGQVEGISRAVLANLAVLGPARERAGAIGGKRNRLSSCPRSD
jgi:hypothetical protein